MTKLASPKGTLLALSTITLLAALLLWVAPEERVMGAGIKPVYVHVALIWTGLAGLSLAGLLGLFVLILDQPELQAWTHTTGQVTLAFLLGGVIMSIVAAQVNWGGVFWQEPRNQAMFRVLAAGLAVQILAGWPLTTRLKGLLHLALALFMTWTLLNTPLVMHPENPARSSTSVAIRLTFLGLFLLSALAAAWIVAYNRIDSTPDGEGALDPGDLSPSVDQEFLE